MIFLNDKIAAGEVKCTHIALASSNRPSVTVWPGGYYQMKPLVPGHIRSSGLNIVHSNGVTIFGRSTWRSRVSFEFWLCFWSLMFNICFFIFFGMVKIQLPSHRPGHVSRVSLLYFFYFLGKSS